MDNDKFNKAGEKYKEALFTAIVACHTMLKESGHEATLSSVVGNISILSYEMAKDIMSQDKED